MPATTGRDRLAAEMEQRRSTLGKLWRAVAADGGTTCETLRAVRKGSHEITPPTRRAIERGLDWPGGYVDHLLSDADIEAPGLAMNTPPIGTRNATLRDVAFEMGRTGATNHEILERLDLLSEQWGKYTNRNLFEKWTRLLGMVREVRAAGIRPPGQPLGVSGARASRATRSESKT